MRLRIPIGLPAGLLLCVSLSARAEILEITGRIESKVEERSGGAVVQSDFAGFDFPTPDNQATPAAVTQLTREDNAGNPISGAQGLTIFGLPTINGIPITNDFGMDLAGFTRTHDSEWTLSGFASERRRIVFNPIDVGSFPGQTVHATSTLYVAGALALAAFDANQDLTGAEARMKFQIIQKRQNSDVQTVLLDGGLTLRGGPNATVGIETTGAMNGLLHAPTTLGGVVADLPVLHLVVFNPLIADQYAYEYDAVTGEPFELELQFTSELILPPNGVAGSAIFGIPPVNLTEVFARVQNSDTGAQVEDVINSLVDTTGSQVQPNGGTVTPVGLFGSGGLCGALGLEAAAMLGLAAAFGALCSGRRRRRAARR